MAITNRERYFDICRFERPGDLYYRENYWPDTLTNWMREAAPTQIAAELRSHRIGLLYFFWEFFQVPLVRRVTGNPAPRSHDKKRKAKRAEILKRGLVQIPVVPLAPYCEAEILSEDERTITFVNVLGQTVREVKDHPIHMPQYLDWPVKDRTSWKRYKKQLNPGSPERIPDPDSWRAYAKRMNKLGDNDPVQINVGGFYGPVREMVGMERLAYMLYDDPNLVEEIMDQLLHIQIELVNRVTKDIKIDMAIWWEDMAYKSGPLISPTMVKKFMMPRYRILTDLLRSKNITINHLDCDGNVSELIPLWLEVGINMTRPLEVAAGNDAVVLRKRYGKELILSGNIDKRVLIQGDREGIREEVFRKVPYLLEKSGYFPSVDHGVPSDITFDSYCCYINALREAAGMDHLPFAEPDYWSNAVSRILLDPASPRSGRD